VQHGHHHRTTSRRVLHRDFLGNNLRPPHLPSRQRRRDPLPLDRHRRQHHHLSQRRSQRCGPVPRPCAHPRSTAPPPYHRGVPWAAVRGGGHRHRPHQVHRSGCSLLLACGQPAHNPTHR